VNLGKTYLPENLPPAEPSPCSGQGSVGQKACRGKGRSGAEGPCRSAEGSDPADAGEGELAAQEQLE